MHGLMCAPMQCLPEQTAWNSIVILFMYAYPALYSLDNKFVIAIQLMVLLCCYTSKYTVAISLWVIKGA